MTVLSFFQGPSRSPVGANGARAENPQENLQRLRNVMVFPHAAGMIYAPTRWAGRCPFSRRPLVGARMEAGKDEEVLGG